MLTVMMILTSLNVFVGLFSFASYRSHLLQMLLSLEFSSLNLFILLSIVASWGGSHFILMYFIVFVVCESAMGLALLVGLVRTFGNDLTNSLVLL